MIIDEEKYGTENHISVFDRPGYLPQGPHESSSSKLTLRKLKSTPVSGNGISPTPYSALTLTASAGSYYEKNGYWTNTGNHIPGMGLANYIPYVYGQDRVKEARGIIATSTFLNQLSSKALVKVADVQMDVGAALAEVNETASHIAKRATDVLLLAKDIATLNVKSLKRRLPQVKPDKRLLQRVSAVKARVRRKGHKNPDWRAAANTAGSLWLEYRYAITPLMITAQEGMKVFSEGLSNYKPFVKIHEGIEENIDNTFEFDSYTVTVTGTAVHRIMLMVSINSIVKSINGNLGLSPTNMMWERVPFSFVLDWGYDVGSFLRALDVRSNVSFSGGSYSTTLKATASMNYHTDNYRYNGSVKIKGYDRRLLGEIPFPAPVVNTTPFKGSTGDKRLADVAAFLTNFLRK